MFFDADREEKLALVMMVVDHAHIDDDAEGLIRLAYGPLELLMGHWLMDRLEELPSLDERLLYALANVPGMVFEKSDLQDRLLRLLPCETK